MYNCLLPFLSSSANTELTKEVFEINLTRIIQYLPEEDIASIKLSRYISMKLLVFYIIN